MEDCCKNKSAKHAGKGKHEEKTSGTSGMQIVLIVLAIGLVLFAGFQTLQIGDIKEQLGGTGRSVQPLGSAPAARPAAPSQPVMVGGC